MIRIDYDDREVQAPPPPPQDRLADMRPAMQDIGEALLASTKDRFKTSTAPDGSRWASNQPSTLERYLDRYSGTRKKDGGLSRKGASRLAGKKPLIGESRSLSTQFGVGAGRDHVILSTNLEYAAVQQFGAPPPRTRGST